MWKKVKVLDYPRYWEKSAFAVEKYLNWEYWKDISVNTASIFYAIDRFDDWLKIDCEINGKMKSIEEINKEILDKIL